MLSMYLNTADLSDVLGRQPVLPLDQLYHADAPQEGLLHLLKSSLWQFVWQETDTAGLNLGAAQLRQHFCSQASANCLFIDRYCASHRWQSSFC